MARIQLLELLAKHLSKEVFDEAQKLLDDAIGDAVEECVQERD